LRPGDLVEVRSAAEILATLDGDAALDRMPFMPEMIPHTRRRYKVSRRVDRVHGKPSHARHGISRESPLRWVRPRRLPGGLQPLLDGSVAPPCRRRLMPPCGDIDSCAHAPCQSRTALSHWTAGRFCNDCPGGAPGSSASGFSISRGRREQWECRQARESRAGRTRKVREVGGDRAEVLAVPSNRGVQCLGAP
jgi:hypothetical protein